MTERFGSTQRTVGQLAFLLALVIGAAGCGPTMAQVEPGTMPPGKSFAGEWFSPEYEKMTLEEQGDKVTGTFSYREGGTITGELEGNLLRFDWEQPGDMSKARRAVSGKGYWVMAADGNSFAGEWGYMDADTGGGAWTAERIGTRVDSGVDPNEPLFGGDRSAPPPPMK